MPKGVRPSREPTGPRIVELLQSEPNRAWGSVEIRARLGIDLKQMNSSLRNLVRKGEIFIVYRGRYAAQPIETSQEMKSDVDVLRDVVTELPEQFTLREVEARLPRAMANAASMLNYMVDTGELHRAALNGGVFSKTPPAVEPLSVYDHVLCLLRREPERVFEVKVLKALTGAPSSSSEVLRLVRQGIAVKVSYGCYQLAPGIAPLPADTILPPPVTRVGLQPVTEIEKRSVVDYLLQHPGSTRLEVATALGMLPSHLGTILANHLFISGLVFNMRDSSGPFSPDHLYVNEQKLYVSTRGAKGRYSGKPLTEGG